MCLVYIEASSTFTADVVGPALNTVRVIAGVAIQRESAIAYTANGRTIASLTSRLHATQATGCLTMKWPSSHIWQSDGDVQAWQLAMQWM